MRGLEIDKRSGYSVPDVVRIFMIITARPMGRPALIRELKLGEASVKTMVKFLKSRGLVQQGTRGVYPTGKGLSLFSFCSRFSSLTELKIPGFSKNSVVLIVKNAADEVKSGIEQRDEGVKFGAKIITLLKKNGELMLAGVPQQKPPYTKELGESLEIDNNDVVILSGADSQLAAERGAVAAAIVTVP